MSTPPGGVYDRPQGDFYGEEPKPSRNRTALLVTGAVGTALVIGGGAFAVTQMMGGGGDQPSSALPAGTAAYLRMDIDPSVGQKIAAVRFLEGLDPETTETLREGDLRQEMFEAMAEEDDSFAAIDYEQDIAPWIGDRLGLGVVPDGDEIPMVAIALQVADQDAAEEGLDRLRDIDAESSDPEDGLAWFFHDDYAVLTTAEDVEALQEAVAVGTLAGRETFSGDMAAVGDEGVMSGWMDSGALAPYLEDAAGMQTPDPAVVDDGGLNPGSLSGFLGSDGFTDAAQGRVAGAVRFAEDHIEVHGVARGFQGLGVEDTDTAQLVLDLPADTAVAVGLEHGDQLVARFWETYAAQFPEELAQMQAEASAAGVTLPDDVQTMVGESMAVSVGPEVVDLAETGGMSGIPQIPVAYRVQTDVEAANALIDQALAAGGADEAAQFLVRRDDDGVLTLGVDQRYVDAVAEAEGGSLGESSAFQAAVPGGDDADAVLYVDLNAFEDLYLTSIEDTDVRDSLEQVAGFGVSSQLDEDGNGEFTMRVVADEE